MYSFISSKGASKSSAIQKVPFMEPATGVPVRGGRGREFLAPKAMSWAICFSPSVMVSVSHKAVLIS
jgi:hypothetical protein